MTTSKRAKRTHVITCARRGRFTATVSGPVRVVHPELGRLGIPWQWDARMGLYLVPLKRLDDLAASLELNGHRVDLPAVALW